MQVRTPAAIILPFLISTKFGRIATRIAAMAMFIADVLIDNKNQIIAFVTSMLPPVVLNNIQIKH